jgi:hypothetical protein
MAYRAIEPIIEVDDDLLQKLVEVRLAMDLLMEKKPEWFYRPHTRDGTG